MLTMPSLMMMIYLCWRNPSSLEECMYEHISVLLFIYVLCHWETADTPPYPPPPPSTCHLRFVVVIFNNI